MAGLAVAASVTAAAAVGSLAVGAINSGTQKGIANQAESQSATVFGEQQGYAQMLQQLISNPASVTSLPGYQFNLQQQQQAVARQFGAQAGSGAEGAALEKQASGYATSVYDNQVSVLSSLAGLSSPTNPTSGLATASGAAGQSNNAMQQLLGTLAFTGNSGIIPQLAGGGGLTSSTMFGGGATAGLFSNDQLNALSTGFASPGGSYNQ